MKRVTAIIEKASDGGYGIYLPEIKGVVLYGYGITEDEARKNLMENLESILEFYEEENQSIPEVLNDGDLEFDYRYDFSGFFKAYPIFNVSALAEVVGVNPSLLRKYKNGLAFASRQQKEKIEQGIHSLSEQLSTVQF
jgi:predicted RNase H-like HicB family nuclease